MILETRICDCGCKRTFRVKPDSPQKSAHRQQGFDKKDWGFGAKRIRRKIDVLKYSGRN